MEIQLAFSPNPHIAARQLIEMLEICDEVNVSTVWSAMARYMEAHQEKLAQEGIDSTSYILSVHQRLSDQFLSK